MADEHPYPDLADEHQENKPSKVYTGLPLAIHDTWHWLASFLDPMQMEPDKSHKTRVDRIAPSPNRADALRDSTIRPNERLSDSVIRRFGSGWADRGPRDDRAPGRRSAPARMPLAGPGRIAVAAGAQQTYISRLALFSAAAAR